MEVVKEINTQIIEDEIMIGGIKVKSEKVLNKKQLEIKANAKKLKRKLFLRRTILTLIACSFSFILHLLNCNSFVVWLPIVIHCLLFFYSYSVVFYDKRNKARAWDAYVAKYGDKNGNIPEHVTMIHKKIMQSGKRIQL